jgi:hypothetical protein
MHASIAVCVMMVGGYIYPEPEIMTIPLRDDLSRSNAIQDQEWRERVKHMPLPRVPTLDDRQQVVDNGRANRYPPADQNAQQRRMPQAPTSASPTDTGQAGYRPEGFGPVGGSGDMGGNNTFNSAPGQNGVYGRSAPRAAAVPNTTNFTANNSVSSITNQYGLGGTAPNPMMNSSAGGNKPYSDYQRPNGYSPWQNLNLPTNNGTISPYTAYVRPAMDQQAFHSHVSEQITGVPSRGFYGSGTPGVEMNMGNGNGLVNPQLFQTYLNYNPANQAPRY